MLYPRQAEHSPVNKKQKCFKCIKTSQKRADDYIKYKYKETVQNDCCVLIKKKHLFSFNTVCHF